MQIPSGHLLKTLQRLLMKFWLFALTHKPDLFLAVFSWVTNCLSSLVLPPPSSTSPLSLLLKIFCALNMTPDSLPGWFPGFFEDPAQKSSPVNVWLSEASWFWYSRKWFGIAEKSQIFSNQTLFDSWFWCRLGESLGQVHLPESFPSSVKWGYQYLPLTIIRE